MTATLEVPIELTPTMKATSTIELRGFMWLSDLFKERHWSNPAHFDVNAETTGEDLLDQLAIPAKRVERNIRERQSFQSCDGDHQTGRSSGIGSPRRPDAFLKYRTGA